MGLFKWLFGWMFGSKGSKSEDLQSAMQDRSPISMKYERAVKNNNLKAAERYKKRLGRHDRKVDKLKSQTERERREKLRGAEDRHEKKEIKKDYKEVLRAVK